MILQVFDLTKRDILALQWQLKGNAEAAAGIFEKCNYGFPQVILLNPKRNNSIDFQSLSNVVWLTCPYLNDVIHELENKGYITKIEEFINSDVMLRRNMAKAHAQFYFLRKSVWEKYICENPTESYLNIFKRGIGGIQEYEHLKCLHLHYAHYRICEYNVAGRIVYHLLEQKVHCDDAICRVSL